MQEFIKKWGALAGAAMAIIAGLTWAGLQVPRPAWSTDLQRIEERVAQAARAEELMMLQDRVTGVEQLAVEQALESAELRQVRLQQEAERLKAEAPDSPLLEPVETEIRILKRRVRGWQQKLEQLQ